MPRRQIKPRANNRKSPTPSSDAGGTKQHRKERQGSPDKHRGSSDKQVKHPPQGDGYLGDACSRLRSLVEHLQFNICMEIDSRYVDLRGKRRKKFKAVRAPMLHRLAKLQAYVKELTEQGEVVVEDLADMVEDGMIVKERF